MVERGAIDLACGHTIGQTIHMADTDNETPVVFKNEDTLRRRAWVEHVLHSVRDYLRMDEDECRQPPRPRLSVVRPDRPR